VKTKLLIVDDDELSNQTLKSILEASLDTGYEIKSLYTGTGVIEELVQGDYKVIILDEKLPGMNGIEILKEINRKNLETKVIFLTGYGDEDTIETALQLGAIEFISKGNYDLVKLIELIKYIGKNDC
jgi:DNA-binding NarL/FixJ family response regulator